MLLFMSKDGTLGLNVFDTIEGDGLGKNERRFGSPGASATALEKEAAALTAINAYSEAEKTESLNVNLLGSHGLTGLKDYAQGLDHFLSHCPSSYVTSHASTPWLLNTQMQLYQAVTGGDDMAVLLNR